MISRRAFLLSLSGLVAASALPVPGFASIPEAKSVQRGARTLAFLNTHTGERVKVTYWENGSYLSDALHEINHVLRDHRTDEVAPIDPALLNQLATLQRKLRSREEFEVISGYRSPASNAMLHERSRGVAKNSYHLQGKAIDIRLPDRELAEVRNAALQLAMGGVGYYRRSDFVHLDTGPVRKW